MRLHVLKRRFRKLARRRPFRYAAATLALLGLVGLDLLLLSRRPPLRFQSSDAPRTVDVRAPGEALRLGLAAAAGGTLFGLEAGGGVLLDLFFEQGQLSRGTQGRLFGDLSGPSRNLLKLRSLSRPQGSRDEVFAASQACQTSLAVHAESADPAGDQEPRLHLFQELPEGPSIRSFTLRPENLGLRVVLTFGPRGRGKEAPACQRWVEADAWGQPIREEGPSVHEILVPSGSEVRIRFQSLDGTWPQEDGLSTRLLGPEAGLYEPSGNLPGAAATSLVLYSRGRSPAEDPLLQARGRGGEASLRFESLAIASETLRLELAGSGSLAGPRAERPSLLERLQSHPTAALLLAALHGAVLAAVRRWAFGRTG